MFYLFILHIDFLLKDWFFLDSGHSIGIQTAKFLYCVILWPPKSALKYTEIKVNMLKLQNWVNLVKSLAMK